MLALAIPLAFAFAPQQAPAVQQTPGPVALKRTYAKDDSDKFNIKLSMDAGGEEHKMSGTVTVNSGTPGADDTLAALFPGKTLPTDDGNDRLSLVITTAGGATTAGSTAGRITFR